MSLQRQKGSFWSLWVLSELEGPEAEIWLRVGWMVVYRYLRRAGWEGFLCFGEVLAAREPRQNGSIGLSKLS